MALPTNFFNPIFNESVVKVEPILNNIVNKYAITWPAVAGATGYNLYSNPTPIFRSNKVNVAPITTTAFTLVPTISAPDLVVHVWIEAILTSGTQLVQSLGATVYDRQDRFDTDPFNPEEFCPTLDIDNDYMRFVRDEIRRRHKVILENDAEDWLIFQRRWRGIECRCRTATHNLVQISNDMPDNSTDPRFQGHDRCEFCFGTGIFGGFFCNYEILLRYGSIPKRIIGYKNFGIDLEHDINSWTLWLPKLHKHDLVVRKTDGQRFIVHDLGQSEWRGVPLHQQMTLLNLQEGDIRELVSDAAITTGETEGATYGTDPGF